MCGSDAAFLSNYFDHLLLLLLLLIIIFISYYYLFVMFSNWERLLRTTELSYCRQMLQCQITWVLRWQYTSNNWLIKPEHCCTCAALQPVPVTNRHISGRYRQWQSQLFRAMLIMTSLATEATPSVMDVRMPYRV